MSVILSRKSIFIFIGFYWLLNNLYIQKAVVASDTDNFLTDVVYYSKKFNVDSMLITAIIKVESDFNPLAVSVDGAMGLMQIMPEVASRYKVKDPFNPKENIMGGTAHLSFLMNTFDYNIPLVVAAYNAGDKAVKKYKGIPPYEETREYVKKVLKLYTSLIKVTNKVYRIIDKDGTYIFTDNPKKFLIYD